MTKKFFFCLDGGSVVFKLATATETMGAWGPMALKFIQDLGSRIAEATGEVRSTSFIFQSIVMAIQRGNAMSILGTTPNMKDLQCVINFS